jgi:hypothetical protein
LLLEVGQERADGIEVVVVVLVGYFKDILELRLVVHIM